MFCLYLLQSGQTMLMRVLYNMLEQERSRQISQGGASMCKKLVYCQFDAVCDVINYVNSVPSLLECIAIKLMAK